MVWQALSCSHGYVMPDDVKTAGFKPDYHAAMEHNPNLYYSLSEDFEPTWVATQFYLGIGTVI